MSWHRKAMLCGLTLCFGLLGTAVLRTSDMYQHYQSDSEYNSRYCAAESKSEERKNAKECQSVLYRTLDDPVALLTGGLVIATGALFAVTYLLYAAASQQGADAKEASKAASLSAEAAKLSATASVRAERAIVIATGFGTAVPPSVPHPPDNTTPPPYLLFRYRFANLGRTPAEIESYCLEIFEGPTIPEVPVYERVYPMVPGTFILPADSLSMEEIFPYNDKRRARVTQESHKLIFYGFVKWVDYLGDRHESRFCTRALAHDQGPGKRFVFVLDANTPEAYTRRT